MPSANAPALLQKIAHIHAVRRIKGDAIVPDTADGAPLTAAQWSQSLSLLSIWIDAPVCLIDHRFNIVRGSASLAARLPQSIGDGAGAKLGVILGTANFEVLKPYLERVIEGEHLAIDIAHTVAKGTSAASSIEMRAVTLPLGRGVLLAFTPAPAALGNVVKASPAPVDGEALAAAAREALAPTIDVLETPLILVAPNGETAFCNAIFAHWFGVEAKSVGGRQLATFFSPDDFRLLEVLLARALTGEDGQLERELKFPDGGRRWVNLKAIAASNASDGVSGVYLVFTDVGARKRQDMALRQANILLSTQLEHTSLASFTLNDELFVTRWSTRAEHLFGWQRDEVLVQPLAHLNLLSEEGMSEFLQQDDGSFAEDGGTRRFLAKARARDGRPFPSEWQLAILRDNEGKVSSIYVLVEDVSQVKDLASKTVEDPGLDSLTKLLNRSAIEPVMRRQIDRARRQMGGVAVLFLDLDQFKNVNDTLGHRIGDLLLIEVARTLRSCIEPGDDVMRIGGDEFMVVSARMRPKAGAHELAQRMLAALRDPITVESHHLSVGGSIGIAVYPDHGSAPDALLRSADLAMYHAKASGRNRFEFFSPILAQRSERRLGIKNALARAIQVDALVLYYQPRVRLKDDMIIGAEALLRWNDTHLGSIAPKEFVGIAEDSGLIHELGLFVFQKACVQMRAWQDAGVPFGILAVNFSAQQLYTSTFLREIEYILSQTGCDPSRLEVEITETSMLSDMTLLAPVIGALKAYGMRIAIDDFGTGFSSLSHLQRLDVDTLKIDQSFIRGMLNNPGDLAITRSVISLGRSLGLSVTAEGVENEAQFKSLRDAGCDYYQGFLFSPAVGAADYEMLVYEPRAATRMEGDAAA